MKRPLVPLLIALVVPFLLGMSKKPSYIITFHTLAAGNDPPKSMFPFDLNGKRLFFKIVPSFTQDNISSFQPFPAENGNGKGMVLQLDIHGKYSLELISRARKDEYLLTMINAKPVDFVVMDEPVMDGVITIWQGVPDDVIKAMEKKVPHMKKGTPTMTKDMNMLPSTKKEKQRFMEATKQQDKIEAERAKKGISKQPDVPSLSLPGAPTAPTSPKIPIEGGSPPVPPTPRPGTPPAPQGEPPLPVPTKP